MKKFKLQRTKQCAKCPWRKDVNANNIPNGYNRELHKNLSCTIAKDDQRFDGTIKAMACHEAKNGKEYHCVGWLANQLGPGNNILLRIQMLGCENLNKLKLIGEQHLRFEDTIPNN